MIRFDHVILLMHMRVHVITIVVGLVVRIIGTYIGVLVLEELLDAPTALLTRSGNC